MKKKPATEDFPAWLSPPLRAKPKVKSAEAHIAAILFTRADPKALAKFDPATKRCVMNCGPHRDDPRDWKERMFLCDECDVREPNGRSN